MWMVPLERLTEDQLDAVQASTQQHRVVIGGPGSGKSLVLIHRAQRLISHGFAADRVKLVVFTKVLGAYLQQAASEIGLPRDFVVNFDRWCRGMYVELVSTKVPALKTPDDWKRMRASVLTVIREKQIEPMFDAVLVDEGQDLTDEAMEILRHCARHLTVALDVRQDLFNTEVTVTRTCELLNVPRPSANLLTAYRCTPLIVGLAAEFLPNEEDRGKFKSANLLPLDGVERPVAFHWSTQMQEIDELALRITERALEGHSTAVLLPTKTLAARYARALEDRQIAIRLVTGNSADDVDFDFLRPVITTYHSVKGLTVDSIFLPGLSHANFSLPFMADSAHRLRLLFVGVTRATKWVWMGIPESAPLAEVAHLVEPTSRASLGGLVVKRSTSSSGSLTSATEGVDVTSAAASASEGEAAAQPTTGGLHQESMTKVVPVKRPPRSASAVKHLPANKTRGAAEVPPVLKKAPITANGRIKNRPGMKSETRQPDQNLTDLL